MQFNYLMNFDLVLLFLNFNIIVFGLILSILEFSLDEGLCYAVGPLYFSFKTFRRYKHIFKERRKFNNLGYSLDQLNKLVLFE